VSLIEISRRLSQRVDALRFTKPVHTVYNPLSYARAPHEDYLARYGTGPKEVVWVGMNPGPFGMAQTGVPFGDVEFVRDWLKVRGSVVKPAREHPKRPVLGFDCERSEVSGTRLWGFAKARFTTPARFFRRFFVVNYCPLCFMDEAGRNITPDTLPASERGPLFEVCDEALAEVLKLLAPAVAVGVGAFAKQRLDRVMTGSTCRTGMISHPSPASPKANRGWADLAERELAELGIGI